MNGIIELLIILVLIRFQDAYIINQFKEVEVGEKSEDTLKAVVVLFRHGDRSPLDSWPNDDHIHNSSLWPDGFGYLNTLGINRQYHLGQWFRQRYDGFLSSRYNHNEIHVRSTKLDRTLMSAASNLAGLYPPTVDQIWNEALPWQPIPVHTLPRNSDPILAAEIPCPKHTTLLQELFNSDEFQQFNQKNAELYQNISDLTGYNVENIDLNTFDTLQCTISIYREMNLTLPKWTDDYWPQIQILSALHFQVDTYTPDLARLRSGPFFDYLFNYFNAIRDNKPFPDEGGEILNPAPKFLMLSAHDQTIGDFTNTMGVYPNITPEFASTVIWEIKTNSENNFYINMYYKNSTNFTQLILNDCEFDCDMDKFQSILEPIAVNADQWQIECNDQ